MWGLIIDGLLFAAGWWANNKVTGKSDDNNRKALR
jgi:hypothetical protein